MKACQKCNQIRARNDEKLCPVCWLVRELKREHKRGEHERHNPSCIRCMRQRQKHNPLPDIPARGERAPAGYSGPFSHSACDHPKTAKARAKCRAERLADGN